MVTERRILLLGGSPSLTAALVAALAGSARITVVPVEAVDGPEPETLVPLELRDDFFIADVPELRAPHPGYGPPRLGKKGKVLRW